MPDEKPVPPFDPDAVAAEYKWRALADHVIARIRAGELPPGARLEGEREMAAEYGVALGTIRRARRHLIETGWLKVLAAKGAYVTPAEEWPQGE
ncbi:winged helix-turn-helix domain-containing protein [Nonomuraea wenchangensis]|uniref:winged helix-turn-helix domain-containing protein n=1 Tax=Nonomuraea wenchangensis TaxID=568860 RepID=UPI00340F5276